MTGGRARGLVGKISRDEFVNKFVPRKNRKVIITLRRRVVDYPGRYNLLLFAEGLSITPEDIIYYSSPKGSRLPRKILSIILRRVPQCPNQTEDSLRRDV